MSNQYGGVYEIADSVSGRRYVGSSSNIESRLKQHRKMLCKGRHHSVHLQRAWLVRPEAFTFRALAILEPHELLPTEQRLLDDEHAKPGGTFNVAKDAVAWMKGRKHTPEWHAAHKARMMGNPSRTGVTSHWKGKKLSDEHRAKLKAAKAVVTEETRAKMRAAKQGPECKARMERLRQMNIGRVPSESTRAKISMALTGRKMPDGALAKSWATRRANQTPQKER